jgi:hypothetical protein
VYRQGSVDETGVEGSGSRRRRRRESRIEIDIERELLAKYPNRPVVAEPAEVDLATAEVDEAAKDSATEMPDDGPTWSAAAEAGIVVPELVTTSATLRRGSRRAVPAHQLGVADFDPTQPLPGEPYESVPIDARRAVDPPRPRLAGAPLDAFESLRRQRDHIAVQVEAAYQQVHAARTDALRRASQAEQHAELAATARERAGRLVREGRRRSAVGRRVAADMPAPPDSFRKVHELRVESLKRAAEAEHGAERVAMLREKAARLLVEQRRLESEMAKHLR